MQRAALGMLLAAACYFANLGHARACSCVESSGVTEDLAASGSVFEGKVTLLRHEPKHHRLTARVEVLRRWKGASPRFVEVVTVDQESLCGFGFERGKSYLLFTPEPEGTLSVSLCSRSKASESAAADFAALDRLAAAATDKPDSRSDAALAPPAPAAAVTPAAPAPGAAGAPPPPTPSSPPNAGAPPLAPAPTQSGRAGCAGCRAANPSAPGDFAGLVVLVAAGMARRSRRKQGLARK